MKKILLSLLVFLIILCLINYEQLRVDILTELVISRGVVSVNCLWYKITELFFKDASGINLFNDLKKKYGDTAEIGYSGHEFGLVSTFAAVAMGSTWVERHVTLDRNMWGSDQSSSIEPSGLIKLVKGIRDIEKATQYEPGPRKQFPGENSKRESLRVKN